MAVDTPATVAVIGAGPIGLEAALYARFLGYDVRIFERNAAAGNLLGADATWQCAWRESISPLGIAALAAQQPNWQPPPPETILQAAQLAEQYFVPLAQSDLLVDNLLVGREVIGIERDLAPGELPEEDEVTGFRLRIRSTEGEEVETADIVIDTSGIVPAPDAERLVFGALRFTEDEGEASIPNDTSPQRLLTSEADYYVLGIKSAKVPSEFRYVDGLRQIRDLFTIIADRASLDLYANVAATN
jgi:threonine dehydrogenase-like Zn-dependent dehydrogenase